MLTCVHAMQLCQLSMILN
jgi:hypothetical protein